MMISTPRLPASVRLLHWSSVLLFALAYLTSESAEEGGGALWHYFAGWALLVVFVPRIALHWRWRHSLSSAAPGAASAFARAVQWSLLVFLVAQPLLGMLAIWAEGDAVPLPFTPWVVPSPIAGEFGRWPEELHETLGNLFYGVIALHAGAALLRHFLKHDAVLRRML